MCPIPTLHSEFPGYTLDPPAPWPEKRFEIRPLLFLLHNSQVYFLVIIYSVIFWSCSHFSVLVFSNKTLIWNSVGTNMVQTSFHRIPPYIWSTQPSERVTEKVCGAHHLCHPSSHSLSQRKDSDSEITEFCPRTEEANNTSGDGDSSEDSFPSLSFSRRLGPQSAHCVLRGRHNEPLVRLIVSGMHVKTRRLKPLFVAFWQSRGADLHPEDSVTVFWLSDEMVCLHSYTSYVAHCSLVRSYLWSRD